MDLMKFIFSGVAIKFMENAETWNVAFFTKKNEAKMI